MGRFFVNSKDGLILPVGPDSAIAPMAVKKKKTAAEIKILS